MKPIAECFFKAVNRESREHSAKQHTRAGGCDRRKSPCDSSKSEPATSQFRRMIQEVSLDNLSKLFYKSH